VFKKKALNPEPVGERSMSFDTTNHHADNCNFGKKSDRYLPCGLCGWGKHLSIHKEVNFHMGKWAHQWQPKR